MGSPNAEGLEFSLIRGGALYRLQERLGLIPPGGLGIARRALLFAAIAWLPVAIGALLAGRALPGQVGEPLLVHYGIHARALVAIPLFVIAQGSADRVLGMLLRYFLTSGVVDAAGAPAFREALRASERLRDSLRGTLVVLGVVGLAVLGAASGFERDELAWAASNEPRPPALSFAAGYYLAVSRPLFAGLLAAWVWRVFLLFDLLRRISRLELRLVATHPDHAAGVGFLERLPAVLMPVVFGLSVVIAARLGHSSVHHGEHLQQMQPIIGAWVVVAILLFLLPLLPFVLRLARLRRQALLDYGALVGRHGRLFEQRWLAADGSDEALLVAPEISAAADAQAVYASAAAVRPLPATLRDVIPYALVITLPFLPVIALEVPLKEVLMRLVSIIA